MKVIILQTNEEFETLQNKIHNSLQLNIEGYNAERWAEANLTNKTTGEIACPIELDSPRTNHIINCLTKEEYDAITDLDQNDENWFPKNEMFNGL